MKYKSNFTSLLVINSVVIKRLSLFMPLLLALSIGAAGCSGLPQRKDQSKDQSNVQSKDQSKEVSKAESAQVPVPIVEASSLSPSELNNSVYSENVRAAHVEVGDQLQASAPPSAAPQAHSATHSAAHSAVHSAVHSEVVGVDPNQALRWLRNGNTRFLKKRLRSDGQSAKDVKLLSKGQKPHTIVFSCSDSRVPPEIIFDQKLGEIFVIRTAGESIDDMAIASAEYALSHLGTRNVLVLGHTHCGAVKAACSTLEGGDAGSESLNRLVKDIHPRLQSFHGVSPSPGFLAESWANADGVVEDLARRSSIIGNLVSNQKIKISSAIYDLETGKVQFK